MNRCKCGGHGWLWGSELLRQYRKHIIGLDDQESLGKVAVERQVDGTLQELKVAEGEE